MKSGIMTYGDGQTRARQLPLHDLLHIQLDWNGSTRVSLSVAILCRWWVNYLTADLASVHSSDYLSNLGLKMSASAGGSPSAWAI